MAVTYDEVHEIAQRLMQKPTEATPDDVRTMAYMICDFMREPWVGHQRKIHFAWEARQTAKDADAVSVVPIR